jgi:hypothetical protein
MYPFASSACERAGPPAEQSSAVGYSISIPTPSTLAPYTQVGFITTWDNSLILIYWVSEINQVLLLNGNKGWFLQPNGRIIHSLAELLNVSAEKIQLDRLFFMKHTHIEVPNDSDIWEIYDHTWDHYVKKQITLHCILHHRNVLATYTPIKPSPLATIKVGPPGRLVPSATPPAMKPLSLTNTPPPGLTKPAPQLPSLSRPLDYMFPSASTAENPHFS